MEDFDLKAELEQHKKTLILGAITVFIVTFVIVLLAKRGGGSRYQEWEFSTFEPRTESGIILDFSDPQLAEDRLRMPEPIRFYTRRTGANLLSFERSTFRLDDAEFEENITLRESR